jgi:hypothetical protein
MRCVAHRDLSECAGLASIPAREPESPASASNVARRITRSAHAYHGDGA